MIEFLPKGLSFFPPASPWGINFGGGIDSTAVIIECINRGHRPDWILFADTGSERPETLVHVDEMNKFIRNMNKVTTKDLPEMLKDQA